MVDHTCKIEMLSMVGVGFDDEGSVNRDEALDDPLAHLIASLEGSNPRASECHDEVIYAADVR